MDEQSHTARFFIELLNKEKLLNALISGQLRGLYKEVFSEAPFFEAYTDAEVDETFYDLGDKGKVVVVWDQGLAVGVEASLSACDVPEIADVVQNLGYSLAKCWYISEVAVRKSYRGKGIATQLIRQEFSEHPEGTVLLLQTHELNHAAISLYRSLGFELIPDVFQEVITSGIHVPVVQYRTVFMQRVL